MKPFLFASFIALLSMPAWAQTAHDPMRGLTWGLPMQAVKEFETSPMVGEEDDTVIYSAMMQPDLEKPPRTVYVAYHFTQDRLDRIRYDIPVPLINPQLALDDILVMQAWLDNALQKTSSPKFQFRRRAVQNDPARWGWTIYRGDGSVTVDWAAPETKARLFLSGNRDYQPRMSLVLTPAQP